MADLKEKLETAMGDYIYQTYICKKNVFISWDATVH